MSIDWGIDFNADGKVSGLDWAIGYDLMTQNVRQSERDSRARKSRFDSSENDLSDEETPKHKSFEDGLLASWGLSDDTGSYDDDDAYDDFDSDEDDGAYEDSDDSDGDEGIDWGYCF